MGKKCEKCGRDHAWDLGFIDLDYGLLGETEAESIIDRFCANGCPGCHGKLIREGRFKCYCANCDQGIELSLPLGDQN